MNKRMSHVAIIMDGNGRWAQQRGRPRVWGHIRGASVVSKIVRVADECSVKTLTLYAFSSENWSRPSVEITLLFKLLYKFLQKEKDNLIKNNVVFKVAGNLSGLPLKTQELIADLKQRTASNSGLELNFAFDYGGREDIVQSVNKFIQNSPGKKISSEDISDNLYEGVRSDVDLLIRTGGDIRVSNFLLWQIQYAELFFIKDLWPEFTVDTFKKIIEEFTSKDRRFGGIENVKEKNLFSKVKEKAFGQRTLYVNECG